MPNILLLAPHFMGYDEAIVRELQQRNKVWYVDNEVRWNSILNKYRDVSVAKKIYYRFNSVAKIKSRNSIIDMEWKGTEIDFIRSYDYVICINGHAVPLDVYKRLKEINSNCIMILYFWDDIRSIFQISHMNCFDKVFSYNIDDCKKYNMRYLPMFVAKSRDTVMNIDKKYDISIIGTAHEDRIRVVEKILKKYKDRYNIFVYLYSKDESKLEYVHNDPLPYEEYLTITAQSRCSLEICRKNQNGPTTRLFDSLSVSTKVITTNKKIEKYPVYGDNILVIQRNKPEIRPQFVYSKFNGVSNKIIYTDTWISSLLNEEKE